MAAVPGPCGAEAAQVGARGQGVDDRSGHTARPTHRPHVEGVGDDDAIELELGAQHAEHDRAQRCRSPVEVGHDKVAGHDGGDALLHGGPERSELASLEHGRVDVEHRQFEV